MLTYTDSIYWIDFASLSASYPVHFMFDSLTYWLNYGSAPDKDTTFGNEVEFEALVYERNSWNTHCDIPYVLTSIV